MIPQLDLFAAVPAALPPRAPSRPATPPPVPRVIEADLPPRPIAWQRLIASCEPMPLVLIVSARWTGVVLETVQDGARRVFLLKNGDHHDYPPDESPHRVVYLTIPQARAIVGRHSLTLASDGTHAIRLLPAAPGDGTPSAIIEERLDAIEAAIAALPAADRAGHD